MDIRQHVGLVDLRKLFWLSVPDRLAYFKLLHLFRVRHGIAPRYLMTNFKAVSEAHSHNTRNSSHNYFVSRDLSLSPSSFVFTAIKAWNSLPIALKTRLIDLSEIWSNTFPRDTSNDATDIWPDLWIFGLVSSLWFTYLSQVHSSQVFYIFYQSIIFQLSYDLC